MSHEKYFDQANLIPTPLPYELERQGDELLLVHWFQRDDKAMLKREIAVLCNWNDKGQDELDGKFLLQSLSELETLKAQLANVESQLDAHDDAWEQDVKKLQRAEIQVRELRELLERHDTCSLRNSSTYARSSLAEATAAALRSAPPSKPCEICHHQESNGLHQFSAELIRNSSLAADDYHPYIPQTDAGEERKELAKVPAGKVDGGSSGVGSLGSQGVTKMPVTMEIGQRLTERSDDSSDSTHANRLKTTDSKESGVNANQDAQSGPQDSPSRSRPRPKPCETCRGRGEILTQGPCYMNCYVCGGSGYPPCPQCGSKFHIECAPPSPAREPEIVIPALPNKPIDYPVKYRNDSPAREKEKAE